MRREEAAASWRAVRLAVALSALVASSASAGGAARVAWLPVSTGTALSSRASFDEASRDEIRALAGVLSRTRVEGASQARWLRELQARLVESFLAASGTPDQPLAWEALLADGAPSGERHRAFWELWVAEQLRLAALFPHPTSEVFPLEPGDITTAGRDLEFILTFDDGPTPKGGDTDRTIEALRSSGLPATFFVLGEKLSRRPDAEALYAGTVSQGPFCVASHGTSHVAHDKLEVARGSVEGAASTLLASKVTWPRTDLFRPPYGQRGPGVAPWLSEHGLRAVLWNIDSQDWRADAKPAEVAGRVLALMLVLRRGVILFHDVHPVAAQAVRLVSGAVGHAVSWTDCSEWPAPG